MQFSIYPFKHNTCVMYAHVSFYVSCDHLYLFVFFLVKIPSDLIAMFPLFLHDSSSKDATVYSQESSTFLTFDGLLGGGR